jgi:Predicted choline kinase involved in LPS biosynthesis
MKSDIIFHFSHFRFQALFPGGVSQLQSDWQYIETALSKTKSPVVFCHNDLLLGNIIYDETEDKVTFIDYEYAGVNYQAFDIANHFDEFAGEYTYFCEVTLSITFLFPPLFLLSIIYY